MALYLERRFTLLLQMGRWLHSWIAFLRQGTLRISLLLLRPQQDVGDARQRWRS